METPQSYHGHLNSDSGRTPSAQDAHSGENVGPFGASPLHFQSYRPSEVRWARKIYEDEWSEFEATIREWIRRDQTLFFMKTELFQQCNFSVSVAQLRCQLRKWGISRNRHNKTLEDKQASSPARQGDNIESLPDHPSSPSVPSTRLHADLSQLEQCSSLDIDQRDPSVPSHVLVGRSYRNYSSGDEARNFLRAEFWEDSEADTQTWSWASLPRGRTDDSGDESLCRAETAQSSKNDALLSAESSRVYLTDHLVDLLQSYNTPAEAFSDDCPEDGVAHPLSDYMNTVDPRRTIALEKLSRVNILTPSNDSWATEDERISSQDESDDETVSLSDDTMFDELDEVLAITLPWAQKVLIPDFLKSFRLGLLDQSSLSQPFRRIAATNSSRGTSVARSSLQGSQSSPGSSDSGGQKRAAAGEADNQPKRLRIEEKPRKSCKPLPPGRKLACQFHKKDPQKFCPNAQNTSNRYKTCTNGFEDTKRLKDHLTAVHRAPAHFCGHCSEIFRSQEARVAHDRVRSCQPWVNPTFADDIMSVERRRAFTVKKLPAESYEDHWFKMWDFLFPEIDRPDSPYQDVPVIIEMLSRSFDQSATPVLLAFFRQHPDLVDHRQDIRSLTNQIRDDAIARFTAEEALAAHFQADDDTGETGGSAVVADQAPVDPTSEARQSVPEKVDLAAGDGATHELLWRRGEAEVTTEERDDTNNTDQRTTPPSIPLTAQALPSAAYNGENSHNIRSELVEPPSQALGLNFASPAVADQPSSQPDQNNFDTSGLIITGDDPKYDFSLDFISSSPVEEFSWLKDLEPDRIFDPNFANAYDPGYQHPL